MSVSIRLDWMASKHDRKSCGMRVNGAVKGWTYRTTNFVYGFTASVHAPLLFRYWLIIWLLKVIMEIYFAVCIYFSLCYYGYMKCIRYLVRVFLTRDSQIGDFFNCKIEMSSRCNSVLRPIFVVQEKKNFKYSKSIYISFPKHCKVLYTKRRARM